GPATPAIVVEVAAAGSASLANPWVLALPKILAPLVDVAVHVVESPRIGGVRPHPGRPTDRPDSRRGRPPIADDATDVGLLKAERVANVEVRGCSSPARIFPLGLRRQAVDPTGGSLTAKCRQALTERLGLVPGHLFDRELVGVVSLHLAARLTA